MALSFIIHYLTDLTVLYYCRIVW